MTSFVFDFFHKGSYFKNKNTKLHTTCIFSNALSCKQCIYYQVCIDKLDDLQLAKVIARLYDGGGQSDCIRQLLFEHVLVSCNDGTEWKFFNFLDLHCQKVFFKLNMIWRGSLFPGWRGRKQWSGQSSSGSLLEIDWALDRQGLFWKLGNPGPVKCWWNGKIIYIA